MTPENRLSAILAALTAAGIDLVTMGATGPDDALTVHLRLRSHADLTTVADLIHRPGFAPEVAVWDVKVPEGLLR